MQIGPVSSRSVRNITRYFHWTFPCADKILCAGRGQIRPMKLRHRQVEVEQLEDRADQSLGLAQRQMEHCAQRQSFRNCEVGVVGLQPGVVRGAAFQAAITSSVNHTVRLPRCRSASLYTHALPGTLRPPAPSTNLARSRPKPSAAGPDAPRPLWRCPLLPAARDDVPDVEGLLGHPASMPPTPGHSAGIAANMAQKERRHLLALTTRILHRRLICPGQMPHRLVESVGHPTPPSGRWHGAAWPSSRHHAGWF
jgi:hypothetical protein